MASKYAPLVQRLRSLPAAEVTLSFDEVSDLVGGLPPSAYELPSWWANDSATHTQAIAWLEAGWRVAHLDLGARQVRLERTRRTESGPTFARPASIIVETAAREIRRAILTEDSAFTPGRAIWTAARADELVTSFADQPDVSGASFDSKLAGQLADVSPEAVQLFTELYYLNMLPLGNFSGKVKRRNLRVPLGLGKLEWLVPPEMEAPLDVGVFNGGVYFGTGRFFQLSYLIRVTGGLLGLSAAERQHLLDEPLAFRDRLESFTTSDVPSQRNALLYLLFPDFYLPIASEQHKQRIQAGFLDRINGTSDLDRDLRAIYDTLSEQAGHSIDLYRPPYRGTWDPSSTVGHTEGPWYEFEHWSRRVAQTVDLMHQEREYKVEMANRLDAVRSQVEHAGSEWVTNLKSALNYGNLLDRYFKTDLFNALDKEPGPLRQLLLGVWSGEPKSSTLDDLLPGLRDLTDRANTYTPGNATALGSVLLMSRDLNAYPPYRPTPVAKARTLLSISDVPDSPTRRYEELLRLCDELLERLPHVLEDRLDAQGLLWTAVSNPPPDVWAESERQAFLRWQGDGAPGEEEQTPVTRAWLIRGSNVDGSDLVDQWRSDGFISLAASRLQPVVAGIDRDALKPSVDADYSDVDPALRGAKLDEFHQFLSVMSVGNVVASASGERLFFGEITGDAQFVQSPDARSNLRRTVAWDMRSGIALSDVPSSLGARLKTQYDVVELTTFGAEVQRLRTNEPAARPVELRSADAELATKLHVPREWLQNAVELLKDRPQLILYGPPGTGKTYIARHLAEHLAGLNVKLVQFHPAYSYEDFFEGYRPNPKGGFELKHGPLRRVAADAEAHPDQAYVLIIDEINRGNIAKIFGELYFLLEYRDEGVDLLYAEDGAQPFTLPKNVFVIGTMNTADRSIALLDSAIRRRFAFVPLLPDEQPIKGVLRSWLSENGHPAEIADLLDRLNELIDDPEFRIGPSYFMRNAVFRPEGLDRVWRTSILPLLEEHLFGELSRGDIEEKYGLATVRVAGGPTTGEDERGIERRHDVENGPDASS